MADDDLGISRRNRKSRQNRRRISLILIPTLAILIAVGAYFSLQSPLINDTISAIFGRTTSASAADREVDYLLSEVPLLFSDSFGGHSEAKLREDLARYNAAMGLLAKEAKRRGIADREQIASTSFDAFVTSFATEKELDRLLSDRGITRNQLASCFERTVLVNQLAAQLVSETDITEKDIEDYFADNRQRYESIDSVRISHIVFAKDDKDTAEKVYAQLQSGADFASLAQQYSLDQSTAGRGGDLGWAGSGTYPEEFEKTVKTLNVGEVSKPFSTRYGIHLITVTGTQQGISDLQSVRDQVGADLLNKLRGQAIEELLGQLRGARS